MLQIPDEIKTLFRQDNIGKETRRKWKLRFFDSEISLLFPEDTLFPSDDLFPVDQEPVCVIDNSQMLTESIRLVESLCESEDIVFGECNAAQFEVTVADVLLDLTGKEFMVTVDVGDYEMAMGIYTVDSFVRQADRRLKKIIAYDRMRKFQIDVASWYQKLSFPMRLKAFRDSLCAYVGIKQLDVILPSDDLMVTKTIDPEQLSGLDVLHAICEINGCFGHIDKTGRLRYQFLAASSLFPSEELFPDDDLFPSGMSEMDSETISYYKQSETSYEDYVVNPINRLQIRQEEGDIGVLYGNGSNTYVIQGNFLVYGKSSDELLQIAAAVYENISSRFYRPCKIVAPALPWVEVGDGLICYTTDDVIETYCLKRTMKGIQSMMDTFEAHGNIEQEENFSIQTQIIQLEGKAAVIKKSVEEVSVKVTDLKEYTEAQFKVTADQIAAEVKRAQEAESSLKIMADNISMSVTDLKNDTNSRFQQTAEQISMKVSRGEVSSEISLESGQVRIAGNRLVVDSTNFKLDSNGNADFSGNVRGANIFGSHIESSTFESADGKFWCNDKETYFGGFYAYESDVSGVNYLATHMQEVGMGDYGPYCFWCGGSGNDPPFYVGMDGIITAEDIYIREQGYGRTWTVGKWLLWIEGRLQKLQDDIDNIDVGV